MIELIQQYFWHILSLGVAPILGFILVQYIKAHYRDINKKKHPTFLAVVNGISTMLLSSWFWPSESIHEAMKIGVAVGIAAPIVVWVWFTLASRWAPEQIAAFKNSGTGENNGITIIPWVYKKKVKIAERKEDDCDGTG